MTLLKRKKQLLASIFAVVSIVVLVLLTPFFDSSFFLHMLFHTILTYALAPMLLVGQFFLWLLPKSTKSKLVQTFWHTRPVLNFLTHPLVAIILSSAVLWFWHIPLFYDITMLNLTVHAIMHVSLIVVFLFYWSPFVSSPLKLPQLLTNESRMLYLLAGAMQGMFLSAIILFSNVVLYNFYAFIPHLWGISALLDQQLGGAVMLVAGMVTAITTVIIALKKQ